MIKGMICLRIYRRCLSRDTVHFGLFITTRKPFELENLEDLLDLKAALLAYRYFSYVL